MFSTFNGFNGGFFNGAYGLAGTSAAFGANAFLNPFAGAATNLGSVAGLNAISGAGFGGFPGSFTGI